MEYAAQDAFVLHEIADDGTRVTKVIYKGTPITVFTRDGRYFDGHFGKFILMKVIRNITLSMN